MSNSIVERLFENKQIERAKSILESNGYIVSLKESKSTSTEVLEKIKEKLPDAFIESSKFGYDNIYSDQDKEFCLMVLDKGYGFSIFRHSDSTLLSDFEDSEEDEAIKKFIDIATSRRKKSKVSSTTSAPIGPRLSDTIGKSDETLKSLTDPMFDDPEGYGYEEDSIDAVKEEVDIVVGWLGSADKVYVIQEDDTDGTYFGTHSEFGTFREEAKKLDSKDTADGDVTLYDTPKGKVAVIYMYGGGMGYSIYCYN